MFRASWVCCAVLLTITFGASTAAHAQFTCNFSATDIFCQNTGVAGAFFESAPAGENVTVLNSPSGIALAFFAQTSSGIATANNQGLVSSVFALADAGNAFAINSGTAVGVTAQTLGAGTANVSNSGTADFLTAQAFGGGNAVGTNSGVLTNATGLNTLVPGIGFPSGMLTWADSPTGNATSINTGTIGGAANQVAILTVSDGGNATTINYGTASGIYSLSGYNGGDGHASVVNYGTVTNGIIAYSGFGFGAGNASVFNAGVVYGGVAAFADGSGSASITNSGLIDGTTSSGQIAIGLTQASPFTPTTLNILPGSRIIGFIDLNGTSFFPGTGTQVNIQSGSDISSVFTFGGSNCFCGLANLVDTGSVVNVFGGAPYVINGNTVAILDPTSFALQDRNIVDVTRTISSLVTGRLTNPASMSGGSTAIGFAPTGNVATDMARDAFAGISSLGYAAQDRVLFGNPSITAPDGTSIWAQGFGGRRVQSADAPTLRSVNNFYGGAMGIDKAVRPGLRVGGFLGAGTVKSTIDLNAGDTTSDMVFGGVYGRYAMSSSFVDFALLGGLNRNDVKRTMANNLVPGGLEYASAKYDGWFISPEIAYGIQRTIAPKWTVTPTARVRYLAANFEGYQETGSTTNLTVASRTTHNFEQRGEVTFAYTTQATQKERLQLSGTIGALAMQRAGDSTVNTVLLGQSLAFATPGKNNVFGVTTGAGFDWRHATGVSVFGATEFTAMSDSSKTLTGRGGVRYAF